MRHVLVIDKVNVGFELKRQRCGLVDQSQLTKVFYLSSKQRRVFPALFDWQKYRECR